MSKNCVKLNILATNHVLKILGSREFLSTVIAMPKQRLYVKDF